MPGRPIMRAQMEDLEAIGEEALLEMVEDGWTVRAILRMFGIGNRAYYKWLDEQEGRRARFEEARRVYAEALDEEGLEIADNCLPDKEYVALAKLRIEQRRHVAMNKDPARRNPALIQQAGSIVNVGSLHLDAVKERMAASQPSKILPSVEAEVIEED